MKKLISFDSWEVDIDTPLGSGASKKNWLINYEKKQRGIFKYPKVTSKSNITGEYWAECLACEIANILNIPCAKVDIGSYCDSIGSMSYMLLKENEYLNEGLYFISKEYPAYSVDKFFDSSTGTWYSLQMIMKSLKEMGLEKDFLIIPLFDALIGNTDRHHSNWGVVLSKDNLKPKISPLYDNGSSLCSIVSEDKINLHDKNWFNAQIDSKSKSIIRFENTKERPTHFKMVEYLAHHFFRECTYYVDMLGSVLTDNKIVDLINDYPDDIISQGMKKLLFLFLTQRRNRIIDIFKLRR